jgi:hypothetical protein
MDVAVSDDHFLLIPSGAREPYENDAGRVFEMALGTWLLVFGTWLFGIWYLVFGTNQLAKY